jgi:hypothetical protein
MKPTAGYDADPNRPSYAFCNPSMLIFFIFSIAAMTRFDFSSVGARHARYRPAALGILIRGPGRRPASTPLGRGCEGRLFSLC